jgi:hypothetical protein
MLMSQSPMPSQGISGLGQNGRRKPSQGARMSISSAPWRLVGGLLPWQGCGLSSRQRSCSADHACVLRLAAFAQGCFRPGAAGPPDDPWTLARDPIFREAARCISFGTCRAYRRAGFCRDQTSCQTTKCHLESRCRVGSDKNCSSGALGERRRRRPRSWRADGAAAKKVYGLWACPIAQCLIPRVRVLPRRERRIYHRSIAALGARQAWGCLAFGFDRRLDCLPAESRRPRSRKISHVARGYRGRAKIIADRTAS